MTLSAPNVPSVARWIRPYLVRVKNLTTLSRSLFVGGHRGPSGWGPGWSRDLVVGVDLPPA